MDLSDLRILGEGRLSVVYGLEGGRMLKVFRYPNDAEREFRQSRAAWQAGVSGQRPYELTKVGEQDAIIYDYLPGTVLGERIAADRAHALGYLRRMGSCHAALLRGRNRELPSVKNHLGYAVEYAPYISEYERGCLLKMLRGLPESDAVLHGDFHPYNVLIEGDRLSAIDWMTCSRGDPAADIARSYFLLRYATQQDDRSFLQCCRRLAVGAVAANAYLRQVLKETGVGRRQVRRWLPVVAAARLTEDRPNSEVQSILRLVNAYCNRFRRRLK